MKNPLRDRRRHQLLGLVFLLVSALFFASMIGFYQKAFTPTVPVTLHTDRAGNEMRAGADVKVRGVAVGEVRAVNPGDGRATVELALWPEMAAKIPADVTARLLPKTLFGERYVSLGFPAGGGDGARLAGGDVIGQDRSAAAIEIERVLDDLLPLLQAVQPQQLSATLNAVSQALDGRGEQLGATIRDLDGYLAKFNPALPRLESVIGRIDDVANTYHEAAPDLLSALRDFTTTSTTIAQRGDQLQHLWNATNVTAVNASGFLEANQDNLIRLSSDSRSTLELFAKYAPQYSCVLDQIATSIPIAERAFGKGDPNPMQKVTIEITGSRGKYLPGTDAPRYDDTRGPRCYPWVEPPDRFPQYPPGGPLQDGSTHPPPPHGPGEQTPADSPAATGPQSASGSGGGPLAPNSPAEQDLVAALLAPSMHRAPSRVPDWSSVLVGPVYRGTEVSVR
ncbi:MCE family protein [Saccharopolyspora gloriosae]|uniref:MCE family protein n=1 Tax=Saccharopolyspora gloriosae TaxID=455344 RepID=UPI001FB62882|nr:MCE family protein [Saccharopolyspora gloriosae]